MGDSFQSYKPVKLHYTSLQTTENHDCSIPPIILIHGLFTDNSSWNRFKSQFSQETGRKIYSIDIRNHGKSESSNEFTLQHMTADVLQFMEDENIKCATLIAHSIGGRIAMEIALHKPEMVENVIVEDMIVSNFLADKLNVLISLAQLVYKIVSGLPATMSETDATKMISCMIAKYMPQFSANGGTSEIENGIPFYKDKRTGEFKFYCNMEVLIKTLKNVDVLKNDLKDDPTYTGRALFVKGEHSIIPLEEDKETILKHFPSAQFLTIKGGYHVSHVENPSGFVQAITNFLNSEK